LTSRMLVRARKYPTDSTRTHRTHARSVLG
jgi:hypothetical protein